MNLKITRPVAFFDLETTGVNIATDRIVEISILKVHPNGNKDSLTRRINPTIPIPIQASEVHGIYDIDVVDCPKFPEVASEILNFISDSDLAGYNSNKFDIPLLVEEFLRAKIEVDFSDKKFIDVQNIFHKMEQRTLVAAYKFYCNKELDNAHSAEADILATYEVLEAQLEKYKELEPTTDFLHQFTFNGNKNVDFASRIIYNEKGEETFNFGKHKGRTVAEIFKKEPSYYSWMMQGDFPLHTKHIITKIKDRVN
ncbi:MAG: exonuclease domain-containing protein [Bacteroidia bacterium]